MKKLKTLFIMITILVIGMVPSHAQEAGNVTIHGFGSWGYGNTDGPRYLYGDDEGQYDHAQFYLNINANVAEKLTIISQFGFEQSAHGIQYDFDYAFAEYSFSDQLKLRVGKVKHAFGIYGELLNVGTIRPFMTLAQGIYGPAGFVGKGLNGIALTGSFNTRTNWEIRYDFYYGQLKTYLEMPAILTFFFTQDPNALNDGMVAYDKDIVGLTGGRVSISTPIDGLNFGFSGYTGKDKSGVEGVGSVSGDQTAYGTHLEYLSSTLWIRSEYIHLIQNAETGEAQNSETVTDCFYLEAAIKLFDNWQVAVRYDWSESSITDLEIDLLPRFFQEYQKHKDIVLGLNYWFSPNLVVKASYHMVEGINFAWPHFDDPMAVLMGEFDNESTLFQIGAQFSF
jgi:hypothetical protein